MSNDAQDARPSVEQLEERLGTVQTRLGWAYGNGSSQLVFALEQAQADLMRQIADREAERYAEEIKRASSTVIETDPTLANAAPAGKPGTDAPKKTPTPPMTRIIRTPAPVIPGETDTKKAE